MITRRTVHIRAKVDDPPDGVNEDDTLLGAETESILVNRETLEPEDARYLIDDKSLPTPNAHIPEELNTEVIELAMRRGFRMPELRAEFAENLRRISGAARFKGHALLCSSVYPLGRDLRINERDPGIVQWAAKAGERASQLDVVGFHMHKEFRDLNFALSLYGHLRAITHYLKPFTVNSPFTKRGRYEGHCSERTIMRSLKPDAGPSPRYDFADARAYIAWFQQQIDAGKFDGASATSFDVRPPRLDICTVEYTGTDICEDPEVWFSILDLYNSLCRAIATHYKNGTTLPKNLFNPDIPDGMLIQNRDNVVQSGMGATIIDGDGRSIHIIDQLENLLEFLQADARIAFESKSTLATLTRVMQSGSPAERKIAEYERRKRVVLRPGDATDRDALAEIYRDSIGATDDNIAAFTASVGNTNGTDGRR